MAKPKDSEIEKYLRGVVQEAKKNDEEITVKAARGRVELQLKLEAGFLKGEDWKQRSKKVIEATFEGEDEEQSEKDASPAPQTSKPLSKGIEAKGKPQQGSKKTATASQATVDPPTKPATAKGPPKKTKTGDDAPRTNGVLNGSNGGHEKEVRNQASPPVTQKSPQKPAKTAAEVHGVKRKNGSQSGSASASQDDEESVSESDKEQEEPQKKKAKTGTASSSGKSSSEDDESNGGEPAKRKTAQKRCETADPVKYDSRANDISGPQSNLQKQPQHRQQQVPVLLYHQNLSDLLPATQR